MKKTVYCKAFFVQARHSFMNNTVHSTQIALN